jgi:hypothetical protein
MTKVKTGFLISTSILVSLSLLLVSCGIPQSELDAVVAEKNTLQNELEVMTTEKSQLQSELEEIRAIYPLRDFETLSEFKDWISNHVQPETTYIDDAFLAAYKVQQAGIADGYLFGIDIDNDEDGYPNAVFVSAFIGNELYYWFVEDAELYGSYGLIK